MQVTFPMAAAFKCKCLRVEFTCALNVVQVFAVLHYITFIIT